VGTKSGVGAFREFVKVVNRPIPTDTGLDEVLWPHFPGFEEAFHAVLPDEPSWVEELDEQDLQKAVTERDDHRRVFGVVSLCLRPSKVAKKSDEPFRFFVVILPDIVYKNCRPLARLEEGHGHRVSRREQ